jgi:hypothetical protein
MEGAVSSLFGFRNKKFSASPLRPKARTIGFTASNWVPIDGKWGARANRGGGYSLPEVIVEISELSRRFREIPQTIEDTLRLLREGGRAEPVKLDGCWRLQLAGPLPSDPRGHLLGAPRHSDTQGGRQMTSSSDKKTPSSNIQRPKRPYLRPQMSRLTLAEARTKLQAEGIPGDAVGQEMLRRIDQSSKKK